MRVLIEECWIGDDTYNYRATIDGQRYIIPDHGQSLRTISGIVRDMAVQFHAAKRDSVKCIYT